MADPDNGKEQENGGEGPVVPPLRADSVRYRDRGAQPAAVRRDNRPSILPARVKETLTRFARGAGEPGQPSGPVPLGPALERAQGEAGGPGDRRQRHPVLEVGPQSAEPIKREGTLTLGERRQGGT